MKGYIVQLRIVQRSHEHYSLMLWINHGEKGLLISASDSKQAGENAVKQLRRIEAGLRDAVITVVIVHPVTVSDDRDREEEVE